MAAKKNDALLVARQTTTVDAGGETYPLLAGVTRLRSSHPVAKAKPELFEPVEPQPPGRRAHRHTATAEEDLTRGLLVSESPVRRPTASGLLAPRPPTATRVPAWSLGSRAGARIYQRAAA